MSAGVDTKANTRSGGALQVGDLGLLEDGSELGRGLNSDVVASETASKGWSGNGQADVNQDGICDFEDLLIVLSAFGSTCD